MILSITDKEKFLNNFIGPLSKVSDSAVLKVQKGSITSLISTSDNTIIISSNYIDSSIDVEKTLNIPDLKKLNRVLTCIEDTNLLLDISSNSISFNSNVLRFKYHLYDDNIINTPKINLDKLNAFSFDGKFTLNYNIVVSLIKGSSISTDTNKLYISVKNNSVFGELTDKTRSNVDSYGILISDNYEGVQFALPIPLNFEIFRIISSMKFKDISANLITKMGILTLDLDLESSKFKFLISALSN
jgi:hypothetical protein